MIDKVRTIIDEQNSVLIDREEEILLAWLAFLSSEHVFYLGLPGLAKSMLSEDMTRRLKGAILFSILMDKETKKSDLLGPPSLSALKNDEYKYAMDGHLPTAHVAFLDEVFKSNSSARNILLSAINERVIKAGKDVVKIPLISVFSASNELPQGKEDAAFFDRFLIRYETSDLDDSGLKKLLSSEPDFNGGTTLTIPELEKLQKAASKVNIDESTIEQIIELRGKLLEETGIWVSPRRWRKGLKILRASALLDERDEVEDIDLELFQHMVWANLDEKARARKTILTFVNPVNSEILDLLDGVEEEYKRFDIRVKAGEKAADIGVETNQNIRAARDELKKLVKIVNPTMAPRVQKALEKANDVHKAVLRQIGFDE